MNQAANSNADLIDRMQTHIHAVLKPLLAGSRSFALTDFPDHNNVGDSAIYLGELAYFEREHDGGLDYICRADQCDYDRLATTYGASTLLIHGGGNFGDIWSWHHSRREALIERFPGRRIIQLPQSVQFNSPQALERTAAIIKRHGNFVLLVRDDRSFELASKTFECTVIRCPDMAFYMGAIPRTGKPAHELLLLLRDDDERAPTLGEDASVATLDAVIDDWRMDSKPMRAIRKILALGATAGKTPRLLINPDTFRAAYFKHLAQKRVDRGVALLSSGESIITDRLHAYIMAVLLDIPRSVIDNSYGKLSGFIGHLDEGPRSCDDLRIASGCRKRLESVHDKVKVSKRLRIFVIHGSHWLTDHHFNGDGLVAWGFINELARRGHEVHVATDHLDVRTETPENLHLMEFPRKYKSSFLHYVSYIRRVRKYYDRLTKTGAIDIVHQMNPVVRGLSFSLAGCDVPIVLGTYVGDWVRLPSSPNYDQPDARRRFILPLKVRSTPFNSISRLR